MSALTPQTASETAKKLADESVEMAACIVVDSPEMYQLAAGELQAIAGRRKKIEDLRFSITRPMDEAKKRVMELFRGPTEQLERAENQIKGAMLTFRRAEDQRIARERAEAERIARAEREAAEAAQREAEAAAEAARAEAEAAIAAGDTAAAAAAAAAASEAEAAAAAAEFEVELAEVAPVAVIEQPQTKAAGIGTRQNWKAEVTDLRALVIAAGKAAENGDDTMLGYLMADPKALGGVARALKGQARVAGVRFYAEDGLSVRAAAA